MELKGLKKEPPKDENLVILGKMMHVASMQSLLHRCKHDQIAQKHVNLAFLSNKTPLFHHLQPHNSYPHIQTSITSKTSSHIASYNSQNLDTHYKQITYLKSPHSPLQNP